MIFVLCIWIENAYNNLKPPLSEIAIFSTKYFIVSKFYTDDGGV